MAVLLAISAVPAFAQIITLETVNSDGAKGDQGSWYPSISADGSTMAYISWARLVDEDTNGDQVGGADHFDIVIWEGTDTEAAPVHRAKNDLAGGNILVRKR